MPLRIIQSNEKVAEVQFICDKCGKPTKTSLMPIEEAEAHKQQPILCYQCKQHQTHKH